MSPSAHSTCLHSVAADSPVEQTAPAFASDVAQAADWAQLTSAAVQHVVDVWLLKTTEPNRSRTANASTRAYWVLAKGSVNQASSAWLHASTVAGPQRVDA